VKTDFYDYLINKSKRPKSQSRKKRHPSYQLCMNSAKVGRDERRISSVKRWKNYRPRHNKSLKSMTMTQEFSTINPASPHVGWPI